MTFIASKLRVNDPLRVQMREFYSWQLSKFILQWLIAPMMIFAVACFFIANTRIRSENEASSRTDAWKADAIWSALFNGTIVQFGNWREGEKWAVINPYSRCSIESVWCRWIIGQICSISHCVVFIVRENLLRLSVFPTELMVFLARLQKFLFVVELSQPDDEYIYRFYLLWIFQCHCD